MVMSDKVKTLRVGTATPPASDLPLNALPEARKQNLAMSLQNGVSTDNIHFGTKDTPHWYALRTTYDREKKAYDYIIAHEGKAFYPTITRVKIVKGKRKSVKESRLPNIFFAYGTEEKIQSFVYDNVNLPYLRFYYKHRHEGNTIIKEPLIVPDNQIDSLKIICESEADDIIIATDSIEKFKAGQSVRIVGGSFAGVVGRVARYKGQQRVAVIVEGLLTVATAYIPGAFLEHIE